MTSSFTQPRRSPSRPRHASSASLRATATHRSSYIRALAPTSLTGSRPAGRRERGCYGNSPLVLYRGAGAYFLDRLEPGVWRLEVMPDAIWVRDPFEKPSPKKIVARIAWNSWPMRIDLPDLGTGFSAKGLNDGNR